MKVREVIAGARRLVSDDGPASRQRSTDADYVDWVEQALGEIAQPRPDLFAAERVLTAEAVPVPFDPISAPRFQVGSNYHEGPADSFRIIEIIRYQPNAPGNRRRAGSALDDNWYPADEISYRPLADISGVATLSSAHAGGAAVATVRPNNPLRARRGPDTGLYTQDNRPQWARHPQSPNNFFFFPKPVAGGKVHVQYAKNPIPLDVPAGRSVMEVDLPIAEVYRPTVVKCVAWMAESVNDESVNSGRAEMLNQAWRAAIAQEAESREITDTEAAAVRGVVHGRAGGAQNA